MAEKKPKPSKQAQRIPLKGKQPPKEKKAGVPGFPWIWIIGIGMLTAFCFWPMLGNDFTNWDDNFYVLNNAMLRGPDWKAIFSQPVADNYHPITMISLALNYQWSGTHVTSYLFTNLFLHVINTVLVFYFAWLLSKKEIFVAVFCAALFGIHPMHVESVAWISERKDLLYTFFLLLSMIQYLFFIEGRKMKYLVGCFVFGVLSLLSKPAAVILPGILLVLDLYAGRELNRKVLLEKIPFLVVAFVMGVLTLKAQTGAMAGLEVHSFTTRLLFACYGSMMYVFKFIWPFPLSAFYPFPSVSNPGIAVWLSPLFVLAMIFLLWRYRKDKLVVFGLLFFAVNIILVIQLISVGQAILAERYTYLPYIGLSFLVAMKAVGFAKRKNATALWIFLAAVTLVFGYQTMARTRVWKNSGTLWSDVIKQYPSSPVPRNNRVNYIIAQVDEANPKEAEELFKEALKDCDAAVDAAPKDYTARSARGKIYNRLNRFREAKADGDVLIQLKPQDAGGYAIRAKAYAGMKENDKAMEDYSHAIGYDKEDYASYYDRGALLFNTYQKYKEASVDFDKAIALHPYGVYYLTQSYCYYKLGEIPQARAMAEKAQQMGQPVSADYKRIIGLQ
jgi:tetratricopeptide (TPR) repeat protein